MKDKDLQALALKAGFTIDKTVRVNRIRLETLQKFVNLLAANGRMK